MAQAIEIVVHGFGIALLPSSAARLSRTGVVFKTLTDRFLQIETVLFARAGVDAREYFRNFTLFLAARLQR